MEVKKINKINIKDILIKIIFFLIIAIIFSLAYRQAPLYVSNQHTKFLHGLARAGFGNLDKDWTANTIDPLPVFSFIVFFTYKFLSEYFFYFFYILILGIFIISLLKINNHLFDFKKDYLKNILFLVIIITIHSTIFDAKTYQLFGFRITEWIIEKGVAMQYLLGSYFQPCVFGVFLLLSIYLFLKEKYVISIILLVFASYIHSAYLFTSGILTLCYMIISYFENKKMKLPLIIGTLAFVLILPLLLFNFVYLGPTSKEASAKALDIIVNMRIPHHSDPALWFNFSTVIKMILISLAIFLVRKKRIFLIILIPFLTAVFFSILYTFIKIDFIGLLAPWRMSVWLLPLSTSIIIGYLISVLFNKIKIESITLRKQMIGFLIFILILHASYGLYGVIKQFDEYKNITNGRMYDFVKLNKNIDDIYLIPVDLLDFRLNTGAPAFVTSKTHPYKDIEVIEWYERLKLAKEFYEKKDINKLNKILQKDKITHIVLRKNDRIINNFKEIYIDNNYIIYQIK